MATIEQLLHEAYAHWDDGPRLARLGREIHDRNRLDHARRVLGRAVELVPDDEEAWAHLSYAHFRDLDDENGRAVLRRAIERTGSDALRATLAAFSEGAEAERLRAEIETSDDLGARASRLGHRFWEGDDAAKAEVLEALRALAAEHPDEDGPQETLMWTLMRARNTNALEGLDLRKEAVPLADRRIERRPDEVSAWALKLMMLAAEKDWEGILETSRAALDRFPDEETVMQMRARAFRETGDEDRAVLWFNRAIGAKPSFAGARIELAKLYEKQGRLDLAEEVFRDLQVANPDYAFSPVSLALFLARRERWEEAERLLLEGWEKLPAFMRPALLHNPDAKPLLEREAVQRVVAPEEPTT